MSDTFGPTDPLSRGELATTVAAIRPDWDLVDAEPMPDGTDIVYRVTVTTDEQGGTDRSRDAVVKCFRTSETPSVRTYGRFLVEVDLLGLVARETDLPVPEVYGVCESHDEIPAPAFLMEHMPGDPASGVTVDENSGVADRFVRESGRYLARVHDLQSFEAFGDLVAGDGDPAGEGGPVDAGERRPVVTDGRDEWADRLRDIAEFALDDLDGTRFADLAEPLRDCVDERLATLDLAAESVLLHGDYRPGNLLADLETGAVTAVLDWGAAQAGDRLYELVWVEREFSNQAPVDSPTRRWVRETLFDAYERERGISFDRGDAFERRQQFYRLVTWLFEMHWFDFWWADVDESTRESRAERLRANAETLF